MSWPLLLNVHYKFRVQFVRDVAGIPTHIKFKPLNPRTAIVHFRDKSFIIDLDCPAYRKKARVYYMVDLDRGQLTSMNVIPMKAPKLAHALFKTEVVKQYVMALGANPLMSGGLIMLLVGVLGGIGLGIVLDQALINPAPAVEP